MSLSSLYSISHRKPNFHVCSRMWFTRAWMLLSFSPHLVSKAAVSYFNNILNKRDASHWQLPYGGVFMTACMGTSSISTLGAGSNADSQATSSTTVLESVDMVGVGSGSLLNKLSSFSLTHSLQSGVAQYGQLTSSSSAWELVTDADCTDTP